MASSKVVTTNPDLPRQSSICSLSNIIADFQQHMQQQQEVEDVDEEIPSKSPMDDLLKNLYSSSSSDPQFQDGTSSSMSRDLGSKTVDEVWKEIVSGGGENVRQANAVEEMTLEDFLTKAGAVSEDDVRVPMLPPPPPPQVPQGVHYTSTVNANTQFTQPAAAAAAAVGFDGRGVVVGGGRGKRRAVQEAVVDKATQQKQRRMIKNRESAARSRERKQAYTVELESLVTQLEEENARLRREEADQNKERFKQLMENIIPVVEKRRPPRTLRRVNSVHW